MSRRISKNIENVVNNTLQTEGNRAKLTSIVEIKRPYTVLKDDYFLERLLLDLGPSAIITDIDIAVSHPRLGYPNDKIYIAVILNGMAKVYMSSSSYRMDEHRFVDLGINIPAHKVSICFISETQTNYRRRQEKITEHSPLLCVVKEDSSLVVKEIVDENPTMGQEIILASSNVSDISMVGSPWHNDIYFDYGTAVFFIANGILMCRRLIKGNWYDAEVITFGPGGPYTSVTATLTWDDRVAVTVTTASGDSKILFTEFLGFGKTVNELIPLVFAPTHTSKLYGMEYLQNNSIDYLKIKSDIKDDSVLIYRGPSIPISIEQVKSSTVEYGRVLKITFNLRIVETNFSVPNAFKLIDSTGDDKAVFHSAVVNSDGTVSVTFDGFNDHVSPSVLHYTPGVMTNDFGFVCDAWAHEVVLTNLNGNSVPYETTVLDIITNFDHVGELHKMEYLSGYNGDNDILNIQSINEYSSILTHIKDL